MRTHVRVWILAALLGAIAADAHSAGSPTPDQRLHRIYARLYALEAGIPPAWVLAVIQAESAWNPVAVSPKGAMGLMQLMPATARRFGVRNPFDPEQNIRGGVAYLAFLHKEFKGDMRLATAAYCAGEGRIRQRGLDYSNREVCRYVATVARLYRRLRPLQGVSL